jgi:hypothetical protein
LRTPISSAGQRRPALPPPRADLAAAAAAGVAAPVRSLRASRAVLPVRAQVVAAPAAASTEAAPAYGVFKLSYDVNNVSGGGSSAPPPPRGPRASCRRRCRARGSGRSAPWPAADRQSGPHAAIDPLASPPATPGDCPAIALRRFPGPHMARAIARARSADRAPLGPPAAAQENPSMTKTWKKTIKVRRAARCRRAWLPAQPAHRHWCTPS